jgi:hypothetical protein
MVTQVCNPSYLEDKDWEDHNSSPAQAKSSQDPIWPMAVCRGTCLSSQLCREAQIAQIGGRWSRPAQGTKQDPISRIPNTKMAGGVAQMAEHQPSKCEALIQLHYHKIVSCHQYSNATAFVYDYWVCEVHSWSVYCPSLIFSYILCHCVTIPQFISASMNIWIVSSLF